MIDGPYEVCTLCCGSGESNYMHSGVCPFCKGEGRVFESDEAPADEESAE